MECLNEDVRKKKLDPHSKAVFSKCLQAHYYVKNTHGIRCICLNALH